MTPLQIYAANAGHTHEVAVDAVYAAGFKEGIASVGSVEPPPVTAPSDDPAQPEALSPDDEQPA